MRTFLKHLLPRAVRPALLALALAFCSGSALAAQTPPHQVTDGWLAVYVHPYGTWYYLKPGSSLHIYYTPGAWHIDVTYASPSLSSMDAPLIGGASGSSEGAPAAGAASDTRGALASSARGRTERDGRRTVRFTAVDPASIRALAGVVRPEVLARLQTDQEQIDAILALWGREQRLSASSFNALRASAVRARRTLAVVVNHDLPTASPRDPARSEAIRTVGRLVDVLDVLLPLLAEVERASHT